MASEQDSQSVARYFCPRDVIPMVLMQTSVLFTLRNKFLVTGSRVTDDIFKLTGELSTSFVSKGSS